MPSLPLQYQYLLKEPAPKMLLAGLNLYGTKEYSGSQDNPVILNWAKELGLERIYKHDVTPWCGLVHAYLCHLTGKPPVKDPLWALNWSRWGDPVDIPMLGDTMTFKRPGGGHVGLNVGEDKTTYHILGGNQGNAYNITRIEKHRLHAARRLYQTGVPANIRVVHMNGNGPISLNEG